MVSAGFQLRKKVLWSVTQTVQVTNTRTLGITGNNPARVDPGFTIAYFSLRVQANTQIALSAWRVYGDTGMSIAGLEANPRFPAPGSTIEALVATTTAVVPPSGIVRVPGMHRVDADARFPLFPVPQFLIMEYSSGPAGLSADLRFTVAVCLVGPHLSSVE